MFYALWRTSHCEACQLLAPQMLFDHLLGQCRAWDCPAMALWPYSFAPAAVASNLDASKHVVRSFKQRSLLLLVPVALSHIS